MPTKATVTVILPGNWDTSTKKLAFSQTACVLAMRVAHTFSVSGLGGSIGTCLWSGKVWAQKNTKYLGMSPQ